ncbi:hypothetical protein B0H10DRAFT_2210315 [Mycena sp. CBHHK59/15]|nr:hypothetical protein B0H10DRAFT_2210315 [Mycena sp. CBHHK59/15]
MPPLPLFTVTLFAHLDNDAGPLLTVNILRVARALLWLRTNNPLFEQQFRGTPHIHLLLHSFDVDDSADVPPSALLRDAFSFRTYIPMFTRPL